jgi:putative ABC transport system permease protein
MLRALRLAFRTLRHSPAFSLGVILTLALGSAPVIFVFALVNTVLFKPLPVLHPERLMMLSELDVARGGQRRPVSPANFHDWQGAKSFRALGAVQFERFTLLEDGQPTSLEGARVSWTYFAIATLEMIAGRGFLPEEDRAGVAPTVILNEPTWRRVFAADPGIVGRAIEVDGRPTTVVGVARAGFLARQDLWAPLALEAEGLARSRRTLLVFGELAEGVTLASARAEMSQLGDQLASAYPDSNRGLSIAVDPALEQAASMFRPALLALQVTGGFILLLAAVNVASLLLGRAMARQRESAVLSALGGGRWAATRPLLAESSVLVLAGTLVGLVLVLGLTQWLASTRLEAIPRIAELDVDARVLAFAGGAAVLTWLLAAALPLRHAWRSDLATSLRQGTARPARRLGRALGFSLVGLQVALAFALLTGALLTVGTVERLSQLDLGFEPRSVLTAELSLPSIRYPTAVERQRFFDELETALARVPGVEAVGFATPMLLSDRRIVQRVLPADAVEAADAEREIGAILRTVSPGYLRATGIRLLEGRGFEPSDERSAPAVALVNQALARQAWPTGSAVGRRLLAGRGEQAAGWEVVGVIADARQLDLDARVAPELLVSSRQASVAEAGVLLRVAGAPLAAWPSLRESVRELDPALPLRRPRTLEAAVAQALARPRYSGVLLSWIAGLALVLAAGGVYALTRQQVEQRIEEAGIRLALGAQPRELLRFFAGRALAAVGLGLALGSLASQALGRLLSRLLFGLGSVPWPLLATSSFTLLVLALVAVYLPARRAVRADPVRALRHESYRFERGDLRP